MELTGWGSHGWCSSHSSLYLSPALSPSLPLFPQCFVNQFCCQSMMLYIYTWAFSHNFTLQRGQNLVQRRALCPVGFRQLSSHEYSSSRCSFHITSSRSVKVSDIDAAWILSIFKKIFTCWCSWYLDTWINMIGLFFWRASRFWSR